ncbi:hypothetical protein [Actinoplanes sp. NPDC049802]|uniref:hypothetical protein n=1 Tax=Actinoplanes sp. NPDC049802 TaxID=3154742 RepID=UPI0033D1E7EF
MSTRSGVRAMLAALALAGGALVAGPALAAPQPGDPQDFNPPPGASINNTDPDNDGYGLGVIPTATKPLQVFNIPRMKSLICVNFACV